MTYNTLSSIKPHMNEFLTNDSLEMIYGFAADFEAPVRYTKAEQFGDIDATVELDIFQDEWSSHFA
jgi:hypothetical protein